MLKRSIADLVSLIRGDGVRVTIGHPPSGDPADLLEPDDVAAWLGVKPATLATWRSDGRGPIACYVEGVVRYQRGDVAEFIRESKAENAISASLKRDHSGKMKKRGPKPLSETLKNR